MDFSAHFIKIYSEKKEKYNAAESRSGHRFMPFILDNFGTVLDETKDMLYQMFSRKVLNDKHDITEAEARFIATRKLGFWLKRIVSVMTKTKAVCIINRSTKLISIQHGMKLGKGSKNSSSYFDIELILN